MPGASMVSRCIPIYVATPSHCQIYAVTGVRMGSQAFYMLTSTLLSFVYA